MTKKLTEFDGEDLGEYPFPGYGAQQELFAQVGRLLTLWAQIEDDLAILLRCLTGVPDDVALAVMGATEDFTTKLKIVDAVANKRLVTGSVPLREWTNIRNKLRDREVKKRNEVAHGAFLGEFPAMSLAQLFDTKGSLTIGPTASRSASVSRKKRVYAADDLREIGAAWSDLRLRMHALCESLQDIEER